MDKPQIMSSLLRFKPGAQPDGEADEDYGEGQDDVLELYRIPTTIPIPEDVLTANQARSVQFKKSKPWGFHPKEVEDYVDRVGQAIAFYIKKLETRDKHVNKLATEVDKYKTDVQNIKFQLEMFQGAGGAAMVDEEGNYVKESDLSESERTIEQQNAQILDLKNKLMMANKDIEIAREETQQALAKAVEQHGSGEGISDEERQELETFRANQVALDEWEAAVNDAYAALEAEVQALREGTGSAEILAEKDAIIAELQEQLSQAQAGANDTSALTAERDDALAAAESYRQANAALESSVESLEAQNAELVEANRELSASNEAFETANAELTDANATLTEDLEAARAATPVGSDSEEKVSVLEASIEELNTYIDTLEAHIKVLEEAAGSGDADKYRITELEGKLADAEERIRDLESRGSAGSVELPGYRPLPPGVRPEDLGLA